MDEFELQLLLDDEKEGQGSAKAQQEFVIFLREIDPLPIVKAVGVVKENLNRFTTEYRAALWFYKTNSRPPPVLPSRQTAIRKLARISKAADTLTSLLEAAYQEKSDIRWFIEEAYLLNLTDEQIETTPEKYRGLAFGE